MSSRRYNKRSNPRKQATPRAKWRACVFSGVRLPSSKNKKKRRKAGFTIFVHRQQASAKRSAKTGKGTKIRKCEIRTPNSPPALSSPFFPFSPPLPPHALYLTTPPRPPDTRPQPGAHSRPAPPPRVRKRPPHPRRTSPPPPLLRPANLTQILQ